MLEVASRWLAANHSTEMHKNRRHLPHMHMDAQQWGATSREETNRAARTREGGGRWSVADATKWGSWQLACGERASANKANLHP